MPVWKAPDLLPDWAKPSQQSVFDPWYKTVARKTASTLGLDDPQSQVMQSAMGPGPMMAANTGLGELADWVANSRLAQWAAEKLGQQRLPGTGTGLRVTPAAGRPAGGGWTAPPTPVGNSRTPLARDQASRVARMREQGYNTKLYTQIDPRHEQSMLQHGPIIHPTPALSGSSAGDATMGHGLFAKPTAADIFTDAAGQPLLGPGGGPLAQEIGKTRQLPLVHRAQNLPRFRDHRELFDFVASHDPRYVQAYGEAADMKEAFWKVHAHLTQGAPLSAQDEQFVNHLLTQMTPDELVNRLYGRQIMAGEAARDVIDDVFLGLGHEGYILENDIGRMATGTTRPVEAHVLMKPEQIRSPFADFDPDKMNQIGMLLSALGAAGAGYTASQSRSNQPRPVGGPQIGMPPPVRAPQY